MVAGKLAKGEILQRHWTLMNDGTIANDANHYMLVVRNGLKASGAQVWCNRKQPLLGVTRCPGVGIDFLRYRAKNSKLRHQS